jgi:hypothetical protein
MEKAEEVWDEMRERKAARQSLYEWLDYQGKLTSQHFEARYLVLYNAAGTNLVATWLDRESIPLPFVVDHKSYVANCDSEEEADYLVAILNSEAVNEAIKPFQSMGLLGERDIHKKVLDLPIPLYSPSDSDHQTIAGLGARARAGTANLIAEAEFPKHLAQRRAWVRAQLGDLMAEIDSRVRKLI